MVLLDLLRRLAMTERWRLVVAHLNHRLRGRASDGDAAFVADQAARGQLPCLLEAADVSAFAARHRLSIEAAARRLRHEFLARSARKVGARAIALAHHADDQVELFLLRLLRGAGGQGLGGMAWRSLSPADPGIELVRPLLDISRAALQRYARARRVAFREDATNADVEYLRNRVRHRLLPLLRRDYQPGIDGILLRTMEILRAEAEFVATVAGRWKGGSFDRLHAAVQRQVLRLALEREAVEADFTLVERLRLQGGRRVSIGPQWGVLRDERGKVRKVRLTRADFAAASMDCRLTGKSGRCTFAGVKVDWSIRRGGRTRFGAGFELLDADRVGAEVCLRHWRAGDRYQPLGHERPVKLQDLFVNQKIPRDRRRRLVVATTASGAIFWVEGLRLGEAYKLDKGTKRRLHWRWQRVETV
jgi:tRNA(Ile)-lysidine synthase